MLKIQSIASGSKGNCVHISSDTTGILCDVGLTMIQIKKRMDSANICPRSINAIVITHEHIDHVLGLPAFVKTYGAKLYVHVDLVRLFPDVPQDSIEVFTNSFTIGDITVDYFPVPHDSQYCFGYTFVKGDAKISVTTDLGRISDDIINRMSGSQIVMIECNHDLLRLTSNKKYPLVLKQRITGSRGHLSNPASAMACYKLALGGTNQILLAHLSDQNNSPTLALECVRGFLTAKGLCPINDVCVDVAEQDKVSELFKISM